MILSNFVYDPNAQYLFKRAYTVSLAPPGQAASLQYGTAGLNPAPLRVRFDIDKNMVGSSNKSKIELYNLSIQSRQSIKKGYMCQLQAGYSGLLETLFIGNVVIPKSVRKDGDIITELECGDGESAIVFARLDKSYGAGTTLAQILTDVAQAMGTATISNPVAINGGIAVGIPNVIYNKGFVAHGSCAETLTKLLKPQGVEWNVQNGNLNIIPINGNSGNTAIVVSSGVEPSVDAFGNPTSVFNPQAATGLIGVPSQNDDFTQFTSLLNPKLVPGVLVKLISENTSLNGFYKIRRSHFEGDSHDNKWQVTCEAIPQTGVVQSLPTARGFNYTAAVV
jgi:hypothetical protein